MAGVQRESEMTRHLQVVGGTDDQLINTMKLQALQLQAANHHCRRMETLLEKLDAATETLIRCCGVERSELRPQVESKPDQWLEYKMNLQQQLDQHLPVEIKADQERHDKALAEMLEQRNEELYQKLMEKLEREEQRGQEDQPEQGEEADDQLARGSEGQMVAEAGLQGEESDDQLVGGLEEEQIVAEAGLQQEECDDQLGRGLEGQQIDPGMGQQASIDQPSRKSRWSITAVCLSAAPLIYYGLLPWLWSVVEDSVQLVHLSPPVC